MSYYDGLALRLSKIRPKADDKSIQRSLRRAFACKQRVMDVNGRWLDGVIKECVEEAVTKPPLDVFAVHAQRLKECYFDHDDHNHHTWVKIPPKDVIFLLNMIVFHRSQNNIKVEGLDIEKLRSLTVAMPDLQAICSLQIHADELMKPQDGDHFRDENEWIEAQRYTLKLWDDLQEKILSSGMKFSSMLAVMPERDPPRMVTGHTEGIYPVRHHVHIKKGQ